MSESLSISFLYKTVLGRTILKALVNPEVSKKAAIFLSSRSSAWIVPRFIRNHKIDMKYYEMPRGGYRSFNDFFTRKMKKEYFTCDEGVLISPSDGLLTVSEIDENFIFHIKHTQYSLKELLKDENLAKEFQGGTALIFRLTPAHYHRYIYTASGRIIKKKRIEGILHSVKPVCHEMTKVFTQNSREYVVIDHDQLGRIVQMEVGALLVGKISNKDVKVSQTVSCGAEKGYFEYGGSSIVVLTKAKMNEYRDDERDIKIGTRLL